MEAPLAGGTPVTLAAGQSQPARVAVDASNIYWTNEGTFGANYTDGTVMRMPKAGGAPVTLVTGQDNPGTIVVDGTSLYFTTHDVANDTGTVMKLTPK